MLIILSVKSEEMHFPEFCVHPAEVLLGKTRITQLLQWGCSEIN